MRPIRPSAFILALCALVFAGVVKNAFVYDDLLFIVENESIRELGRAWEVWLPSHYAQFTNAGTGPLGYRPLVTLTYFLDFACWGLRAEGYHLTQLVLHGLGALALYLVACSWLGGRRAGLLAATLFALHPVTAESVNSPGFRDELMLGLFSISAIAAYHGARNRDGAPVLAIVLFVAALSCKVSAVVLPLVLLAIERAKRRGSPEAATKRIMPFFVICLLALAVRGLWLKSVSQIPHMGRPTWTIGQTAKTYAQILAFPRKLSLDWPEPAPFAMWSLAGLAVLLWPLLSDKHRSQARWLALALAGAALLPYLNWLPLRVPFAERRAYVAVAGFAMGFVAVALPGNARRLHVSLLLAVLATLGARTMARCAEWVSPSALWSSTIRSSPNSSVAHNELGTIYYEHASMRRGLRGFRRATELNGYNAEAWLNLGNDFLFRQKRPSVAVGYFTRALDARPRYPAAELNLGEAYRRDGQVDRAIEVLRRLLSANPNNAKARNNLGACYHKLGDLGRAARCYAEAVEMDSSYSDARRNLELVRAQMDAKSEK